MKHEKLNLFLQPVGQTSVVPLDNKPMLLADKGEMSHLVSQIIEGVDDGYADPLAVLVMGKKLKYMGESIVDAMDGKVVIPEEKEFEKYKTNIRAQQTGVRYYFDGCNDPIWNDLNCQLLEIKEKMKPREAYLKSLKKPVEIDGDIIDEETGEVIFEHTGKRMIYPAAKSGKDSLVFTLK